MVFNEFISGLKQCIQENLLSVDIFYLEEKEEEDDGIQLVLKHKPKEYEMECVSIKHQIWQLRYNIVCDEYESRTIFYSVSDLSKSLIENIEDIEDKREMFIDVLYTYNADIKDRISRLEELNKRIDTMKSQISCLEQKQEKLLKSEVMEIVKIHYFNEKYIVINSIGQYRLYEPQLKEELNHRFLNDEWIHGKEYLDFKKDFW